MPSRKREFKNWQFSAEVLEDGRITIPEEIRRVLKIGKGDIVTFPRIRVTKMKPGKGKSD